MLKWRLFLGTSLILVLIGLCWLEAQSDLPYVMQRVHILLPGLIFMPVLLGLTWLATREVIGFARRAGLRPATAVIYAGNLLLVLAQWLPTLNLFVASYLAAKSRSSPTPAADAFAFLPDLQLILLGSQSALWALGLAVIVVFVAEMRRFEKPGGALANIAAGVFCLVYVGMMLTFVVQMRLLWGVGAIAAWILTVKMGDIGAYTAGRIFGRTRMAPTISPGKTVEGACGAIVFACLAAWFSFHAINWLKLPSSMQMHWVELGRLGIPWFRDLFSYPGLVDLAPPAIAPAPGVPLGWMLFGLAMAVVGIAGDLAESLLKRDVGCKDSSTWLPGFGGVLDILDSLLLSAPVAWLCWSLHLVGGASGM